MSETGSTDKTRAQVGDDRVLAASALLQVDFELRGMDAFGVLVEFGAARAPAHGFDLGHIEDELFGDQARRGWTRPSDMPGLKSMLMVKVPSLKGGRNARGSSAAAPTRHDDRQQREPT